MTETEALMRYDAFIWRQVYTFYRIARLQRASLDDLYQEARLAFLQHIRTHDESMWMACTLTIKGALFDYVRRSYPLKASRKKFVGVLREQISFLKIENCITDDRLLYEDDHTAIDLWAILDKLSEEERQIIAMRLEAMTHDEIGKQMNVSRQVISYRLKAIRRKMVA